MAKKQRPLTVDIPRPGDEQPVWSRVGVIALVGFVIGVAWPKLAGVRIGPSVPGDPKPAAASAATTPSAPAPASAAPPPEAEPSEPAAANAQRVVIGPGRITRCFDKKNKKVSDCGELQFDPVALPRLKELARCPAAAGLEGKIPIGFEVDFEKKEVQVVKGKKVTIPAATVNGVLQCAAREFANVSLEDIPHKHRRYSLVYTATFFPPGKHDEAAPDGSKEAAGGENPDQAAGTTTSETAASGLATVSWDTALVRSAPKEGDVVMRLVRGTRVKLVGRQSDWYKIDHRGKTGWVYRGSIGL